jgi:hypothetical protein
MHEGDNPSLSDEFIEFILFSWTVQFMSVFLNKYRTVTNLINPIIEHIITGRVHKRPG